METKLFRGARLKVERANQHIVNLNHVLTALEKTYSYRLYVEKDAKTGDSSLMFEVTGEAPDEISLIIGDIIHNLRTALDHVAYEIVSLSGSTPSRGTCFPLGETREKCIKAIRKGAIEGVSTDIVTLIRDVIKPYGGGNDALYTLHDLDIVDKHRLVIPTIFISAVIFPKATIGKIQMTNFSVGCAPGGKICVARIPGDIQVESHVQPTLMVCFQNVEVFEGQPVIPTLHQLSQLVSRVIDHIAEKYLALS